VAPRDRGRNTEGHGCRNCSQTLEVHRLPEDRVHAVSLGKRFCEHTESVEVGARRNGEQPLVEVLAKEELARRRRVHFFAGVCDGWTSSLAENKPIQLLEDRPTPLVPRWKDVVERTRSVPLPKKLDLSNCVGNTPARFLRNVPNETAWSVRNNRAEDCGYFPRGRRANEGQHAQLRVGFEGLLPGGHHDWDRRLLEDLPEKGLPSSAHRAADLVRPPDEHALLLLLTHPHSIDDVLLPLRTHEIWFDNVNLQHVEIVEDFPRLPTSVLTISNESSRPLFPSSLSYLKGVQKRPESRKAHCVFISGLLWDSGARSISSAALAKRTEQKARSKGHDNRVPASSYGVTVSPQICLTSVTTMCHHGHRVWTNLSDHPINIDLHCRSSQKLCSTMSRSTRSRKRKREAIKDTTPLGSVVAGSGDDPESFISDDGTPPAKRRKLSTPVAPKPRQEPMVSDEDGSEDELFDETSRDRVSDAEDDDVVVDEEAEDDDHQKEPVVDDDLEDLDDKEFDENVVDATHEEPVPKTKSPKTRIMTTKQAIVYILRNSSALTMTTRDIEIEFNRLVALGRVVKVSYDSISRAASALRGSRAIVKAGSRGPGLYIYALPENATDVDDYDDDSDADYGSSEKSKSRRRKNRRKRRKKKPKKRAVYNPPTAPVIHHPIPNLPLPPPGPGHLVGFPIPLTVPFDPSGISNKTMMAATFAFLDKLRNDK